MGERIDVLIGALQCLNTARQLHADGVLSSTEQAIMWDRKVNVILEPLIETPARGILASMFGGAAYGKTVNDDFIEAHIAQDTEQWRLAKQYARAALLNSGLVDPDKEEVL